MQKDRVALDASIGRFRSMVYGLESAVLLSASPRWASSKHKIALLC